MPRPAPFLPRDGLTRIGLTGSIAMGKSTAGAMLRGMGCAVYDADAAVHALMAPGGAAIPAIRAAFADHPQIIRDGAVDRRALGAIVFADPGALTRLEAILHPRVRAVEDRLAAAAKRLGRARLVLDVPLLLEGGDPRRCDLVLVVSAPQWLQRARVLARPGMTPDKLQGILDRQMPDARKRALADRVIPTSLGRGHARRALRRALADRARLSRLRDRRRARFAGFSACRLGHFAGNR